LNDRKAALDLDPGERVFRRTELLLGLDALDAQPHSRLRASTLIHPTLPKIHRVRRMIQQVRPECEPELDGGIDQETAPLGVAAGANVLVAGASIFGCRQGIEAAISRLREVTK